MSFASMQQTNMVRMITAHGQQVTRSRPNPAITNPNGLTAVTFYTIPKLIDEEDATQLMLESAQNLAEAPRVNFLCDGFADVLTDDTIPWDGATYKVLTVLRKKDAGLIIKQNALAVPM